MNSFTKKSVHDTRAENAQNQTLKMFQSWYKPSESTRSEISFSDSESSSEEYELDGSIKNRTITKEAFENTDHHKDDYAIKRNFDLKGFNSVEKEIYEKYQKDIDKLVELQRNRNPRKVIIIVDERDVFTETEICTDKFVYRIFKGVNLNLSNLFKYLSQDPDFGSGVLYIILCGINLINKERFSTSCLSSGCPSPYKYLDDTDLRVNLISEALQLHKQILEHTINDSAVFSGLFPTSPNNFNSFSYESRKCSEIHESFPPLERVLWYDNYKIYLYNTFTKVHSKFLGFNPLNLEKEGFIVQYSDNSNKPTIYAKFSGILKNGYNFTTKYASYRKSVILKKCDKLMSILLIEANLEQNTNPRINSGICSRNNFNIVNAKRPLTSTKYGESYGHPKFSSAEEENSSNDDEEIVPEKGSVTISNFSLPKEGKETRSTLGAPSKIQSSNSFGQNELCYQLACPLPKSVPLEVSARKVTKTPKYDRIVVLGNTHYNYYLEQLKGTKVCVMSDNISTENLLAYIERKKVLMPLKTLWVLVTGIDFLFRSLPYKSCTDFNCIYPLRLTRPADGISTTSRAVKTFDEIKVSLEKTERKIKKVLNSDSDFIFYPPLPPAMIVDTSVTHEDLHKLILKHPKSYIIAYDMVSCFSDIFQHVSLIFARLTWIALNNMKISVTPLEKYIDLPLHKIDFIDKLDAVPSNKLQLFRLWSDTFIKVITSCLNDSVCLETSKVQKKMSSTKGDFSINNKKEDETNKKHVNYENLPSGLDKSKYQRKKSNIGGKNPYLGTQKSVSGCVNETPEVEVDKILSQSNFKIMESSKFSKSSKSLEYLTNKNEELLLTKNKSDTETTASRILKPSESSNDPKTSPNDTFNTQTRSPKSSKNSGNLESLSKKDQESLPVKSKYDSETASTPILKLSVSCNIHETSLNDTYITQAKISESSQKSPKSKRNPYNLPSNIKLKECSVYLKDVMKRKKYLLKYDLQGLSKRKHQTDSISPKLSNKDKYHKNIKGSKVSIKEKHSESKSNNMNSKDELDIVSKSSKLSSIENRFSNKNSNFSSNKKNHIRCKNPKLSSEDKNSKISSEYKKHSKSKENHFRSSDSFKTFSKEKQHINSKISKPSDKEKCKYSRKEKIFNSGKRPKHLNKDNMIVSRKNNQNRDSESTKFSISMTSHFRSTEDLLGGNESVGKSPPQINNFEISFKTCKLKKNDPIHQKPNSDFKKQRTKSFESCLEYSFKIISKKTSIRSMKYKKHKDKNGSKKISTHSHPTKKIFNADSSKLSSSDDKESRKTIRSKDKPSSNNVSSPIINQSCSDDNSISKQKIKSKVKKLNKDKRINANDEVKLHSHHDDKMTHGKRPCNESNPHETPVKRIKGKSLDPNTSICSQIDKESLNSKKSKRRHSSDKNNLRKKMKLLFSESSEDSDDLRENIKHLFQNLESSEDFEDSREIYDSGSTMKKARENSLQHSSSFDQTLLSMQVNNSEKDSPNHESVKTDYQKLKVKQREENSPEKRDFSQETNDNLSSMGFMAIPQTLPKPCSLGKKCEKESELIILKSDSIIKGETSSGQKETPSGQKTTPGQKETTSGQKENISDNCEPKNPAKKIDDDEISVNSTVGISDEMRTYILKCAKEILSKFTDKKIKEENLPKVLLSFCKANKLTDIKEDESLDKNLNQHLFLSKECKNRPLDYFSNLLYLYNILTNKTTSLFSEPSENSKDLRTPDAHVTSKKSGSSSSQSLSSCDQSLVPVQVCSSENDLSCHRLPNTDSHNLTNKKEEYSAKRESIQLMNINKEGFSIKKDSTPLINKNKEECSLNRDSSQITNKNKEEEEECSTKKDSSQITNKNKEERSLKKDSIPLMKKNKEESNPKINSTQLVNMNKEECNLKKDSTRLINRNKEECSLKKDSIQIKNKNKDECSLERETTQSMNKNKEKCSLKRDSNQLINKNKVECNLKEDYTQLVNKNKDENNPERESTQLVNKNKEKCNLKKNSAKVINEKKEECNLKKDSTQLINENKEECNLKKDSTQLINEKKEECNLKKDSTQLINEKKEERNLKKDSVQLINESKKECNLKKDSTQLINEKKEECNLKKDSTQLINENKEECNLKKDSTQLINEKKEERNLKKDSVQLINESKKECNLKKDSTQLINEKKEECNLKKDSTQLINEKKEERNLKKIIIIINKKKKEYSLKRDSTPLKKKKNVERSPEKNSTQLMDKNKEECSLKKDSTHLKNNSKERSPERGSTHDKPFSKDLVMKSQTHKQKPCPLSKKRRKESNSGLLVDPSIKATVSSSKETTLHKKENVVENNETKKSSKVVNADEDSFSCDTDKLSDEMQAYILNCAKETLLAFTDEEIKCEDVPKGIILLCKESELENIREDESIPSLYENLKHYLAFMYSKYGHSPHDSSKNFEDSSKTSDSGKSFSQSSKSCDPSVVLAGASSSEKDSPSHKLIGTDHQKLMDQNEEQCSVMRESTQGTPVIDFSKDLLMKSQTRLPNLCSISKTNKKECESTVKSNIDLLKDIPPNKNESILDDTVTQNPSNETDNEENSLKNNDELSDKMRVYILRYAKKTLSSFTDEDIKDEDIPKAIILLCKDKHLEDIKEDESIYSLYENLKRYLVFASQQYNNLPLSYFYDAPYINKLTKKDRGLFNESSEDSAGTSDSHTTSEKSRCVSIGSSSICDESLVDSVSQESFEDDCEKVTKEKSSSPNTDDKVSSSDIVAKSQKPSPLSKNKYKKEGNAIILLKSEDSNMKAEVRSLMEPISEETEIPTKETYEPPNNINDPINCIIQSYILNCAKEILAEFTNEEVSNEDIPKAIITLCKEYELDNVREDGSISSLDRNVKQFLVFLSIDHYRLSRSYYYNAPYHLPVEEFSQMLNAEASKININS